MVALCGGIGDVCGGKKHDATIFIVVGGGLVCIGDCVALGILGARGKEMMEQTWQWWLAMLCMGGVTFLLRAAPLLLPKSWLKAKLLTDLNAALPLSVLVLLLLTALRTDDVHTNGSYLAAELLAVGCVLLVHIRFRNVLFSMIAGVAALNGFLMLLGAN